MNKSIPQKPAPKVSGHIVAAKLTSSTISTSNKQNASNSKASTNKKAPTEWRQRISPENYELLRETFLIFDEDGSGIIDPSEITKVLEELGLNRRNEYVTQIIIALRETNKKLSFEEFVQVVAGYTGEVKTKDGLRRVFSLYDPEQTGVIEFEQIKKIARDIGQTITDDDLLDLMHSVFINHKTTSNESLSFEEFYTVISSYYSRKQIQNRPI